MTTAPKDRIRREMLLRLRALSAAYVQAASARLRELLRPLLAGCRRVCLYAPLAHEVNVLPLLSEAPECSFYFPRCLPGRRMSFQRVQNPDRELIPGEMGIRKPLSALPAIEPSEVDLMVLPGLAFEPLSGGGATRLGYGGGYYDRYLPLLPPTARTVALALPEQIITDLPTEAHDTPVQTLLTL